MLKAYITALGGAALQAIVSYDNGKIEVESDIEDTKDYLESVFAEDHEKLDIKPSTEPGVTDGTRWVTCQAGDSEEDFRYVCMNCLSVFFETKMIVEV